MPQTFTAGFRRATKGIEDDIRLRQVDAVGVEKALRLLAGESHGLLSRSTVIDHGGTDYLIKRELRLGRWTEMHPGVYYLNVTPVTWRTELLASVLAAGPAAVASHRTAAVLMGLEGISTQMIELTVPYSDRPMPEGVIVHRTRRALPGVSIDGIPTCTPERTLLDLAAVVPASVLEKSATSAVRLQLVTLDDVDEAIRLYGGRGVSGTRKLRRVLRVVDGDITGSPAEVDLNRLIRGSAIPRPSLQLRIVRPDGSNAYPDFAWPDRMKIVEVDGLSAHWTEEQLQADLIRQNELMLLGWEVRRFSARQVRRDPQGVLEQIARFVNDA